MMLKYGRLALAEALSGTPGQVVPERAHVAVTQEAAIEALAQPDPSDPSEAAGASEAAGDADAVIAAPVVIEAPVTRTRSRTRSSRRRRRARVTNTTGAEREADA
jgi:hypothetical protein